MRIEADGGLRAAAHPRELRAPNATEQRRRAHGLVGVLWVVG